MFEINAHCPEIKMPLNIKKKQVKSVLKVRILNKNDAENYVNYGHKSQCSGMHKYVKLECKNKNYRCKNKNYSKL